MDNILVVGCSADKNKKLIKILGRAYQVDYRIDSEAALRLLTDTSYNTSLILLCIDVLINDGMHFLSVSSTHPELHHIPVVIVAEDAPSKFIGDAIDYGAFDYININMDPRIIFHRIRNIIETAHNLNPQMEAMNTFMFNQCIGAAMLIEVKDDKIRALKINEKYYELMDFDRQEYDRYRDNLMATVLTDELSTVKETIENAKSSGFAQCVMSNLETGRSFQVVYHLIGKPLERTIFLITVEDITANMHSKVISDAMLHLPGMIFYDYDTSSNKMQFYINKGNGECDIKVMTDDIDSQGHAWLSAESYTTFKKVFDAARNTPMSGSFEVQAKVAHRDNTWHRLYYRSIINKNGDVFRIVGRLDDLERSVWSGLKGGHFSICDTESNLLTYQAVNTFMDQALGHKKEGTLLLLDIIGLNNICEDRTLLERQNLLRGIVQNLKNLFVSTDIMGRFGEEGFVIFMPETSDYNLAKKKATALINLMADILKPYNTTYNIGVSIVNPSYHSAASVLCDANIALWEAKEHGNKQYVIFNH